MAHSQEQVGGLTVDLERFFSVGPEAPVAAQDVFTNRLSELESFDAALASFAGIDPVSQVEDTRSPRRNVLVYYGMGGVGKTRLSLELERRFHHEHPHSAPPDRVKLAHRVDFDVTPPSDLETLLLGVRATLGRHRATWPAFDLAFAAYWERAHPGVPMQATLSKSSSVRQLGQELDLGNQIQDAVEDLLDSPGGVLGVFTAGAKVLGRSVVQRIREQRLLQECPFFGPVVAETDPSIMRPYLAALLAWDLARIQLQDRVQVVSFLDTWERVQEHDSRRGGPEDLLARVIHLMPTVLFVVTGRNQLRWADPTSMPTMQWAGPDQWPNLVPGASSEPRQHLVGSLSASDAGRYLRERLLRDGKPAIPPAIRAAIVNAAHGLPLYLDLAATHFDELVARGVEPQVDDFGQALPDLVLRIMRDLDDRERFLLRTASLLRSFDAELLRAAAPDVSDACLAGFVRRTFISRDPDSLTPFSLHESLRQAVRERDIAEDGWSRREWDLVADRLLAELHRRCEPELRASGTVDRALLIGVYMEAFRLSGMRGLIPPWVVATAARLQSLGERAVLAWTDSTVAPNHPLESLAQGLAAIGRRSEEGHKAAATKLRASLQDQRLDAAGRDYLTIWLSWMLEGLGERQEAEALRLGVAQRSGPFSSHARHAVGRADWVNGRLRRCLAWEFDDRDPLQRFWQRGLHGRVAWILGRFDEAEGILRDRVAAAEQIGSLELLAHALRTLGESRCWSDPGGEDDDSRQAAAIYRRLGNRVSRGEALTSSVVMGIGFDDPGYTLGRLAETGQLMNNGGYAEVARVFMHCLYQDRPASHAARNRFLSQRKGRAYGFWDAITGWWIQEAFGSEVARVNPDVEWLYGYEDAWRRWVDVLTRRSG